MANPFLVLGGIAVGIITATFGILQVPGWVDSAKDASAKNDIAQVSLAQAAAMSTTGKALGTVEAINADTKIGVQVSAAGKPYISVSTDGKSYFVVVKSGSGKFFSRMDSGDIKEHTNFAALTTSLGTLTGGLVAPASSYWP